MAAPCTVPRKLIIQVEIARVKAETVGSAITMLVQAGVTYVQASLISILSCDNHCAQKASIVPLVASATTRPV